MVSNGQADRAHNTAECLVMDRRTAPTILPLVNCSMAKTNKFYYILNAVCCIKPQNVFLRAALLRKNILIFAT